MLPTWFVCGHNEMVLHLKKNFAQKFVGPYTIFNKCLLCAKISGVPHSFNTLLQLRFNANHR